jgi:adenylate cyclase class IV
MRNVEAKFALPSLAAAAAAATAIGFLRHSAFTQVDTFFAVPHGRLKLREEPGRAALIHYRRRAQGPLQLSDYDIVSVADAPPLRALLTAALGRLAEVRKHRTLLLRRNIRLHLDQVERLGAFGELEAVLAPDSSPDDAAAEVRGILATLGVVALIEKSYFEMLAERAGAPSPSAPNSSRRRVKW